jgi:hypothetical protein
MIPMFAIIIAARVQVHGVHGLKFRYVTPKVLHREQNR